MQERKLQRLGDTQLRDVDVRVIAVTNRALEFDVQAGRFREDLYYRLRVFPIHLPTLRERLEDIPLLADHLLQKACAELNKPVDGFAPGVIEMLQSYRWPGNIRELENGIRRAVALVEAGLKIQTYHFPPEVTDGESLLQVDSPETDYRSWLDALQRGRIERALRECGGNRSEAARRLGLKRTNLIRLMNRLGMAEDETT